MSCAFLNGFFITTVWGGRRFRPLEVRWTLLFVARKFQLFFAFFLKFNHYNFFKAKKAIFLSKKSNFLKSSPKATFWNHGVLKQVFFTRLLPVLITSKYHILVGLSKLMILHSKQVFRKLWVSMSCFCF